MGLAMGQETAMTHLGTTSDELELTGEGGRSDDLAAVHILDHCNVVVPTTPLHRVEPFWNH